MNLQGIVSIRFKEAHFDTQLEITQYEPSINKAKARSRRLGGAGKVIAAKTAKQFVELRDEVLVRNEAERETLRLQALAKTLAEEQGKLLAEDGKNGR